MTQIPGVHIETSHHPAAYSDEQLAEMCLIAADLDRGKFIYTPPPAVDCLAAGLPCEMCLHFAAEDDDLDEDDES